MLNERCGKQTKVGNVFPNTQRHYSIVRKR